MEIEPVELCFDLGCVNQIAGYEECGRCNIDAVFQVVGWRDHVIECGQVI
jgi:hypothetical protein